MHAFKLQFRYKWQTMEICKKERAQKMISIHDIANLKLTKKQKNKLLAKGKFRDPFEIWVDHHNHKLEVIRTCSSFIGMIVSCIIMLKVFGIIR